jgi:hypothetical protein
MLIGYIKTKRYVPDLEAPLNKIEYLENNVTFATSIHPANYVLSLAGVAMICYLLIIVFKKVL